MSGAPLLDARDITVRFGGVVAVSEVSLQVHPGEVLGLIGPNGSGKSTFLNAVTGLVRAKGSVSVAGAAIPMAKPGAIVKHGVYRTYQTPQVDRMLTCLENVLVASPDQAARGPFAAWVARPLMWRHDRKRWEDGCEALRRVDMLHRANDSAAGLSYGEQRRLEIARGLMADPKLLLMDEPAAGLNSAETAGLADLLKTLRRDGLSLLVVEHKISFLESLCDRIVVLELGSQIAEGTPAEVWKNPAVMAAYLGDAP